MTSSRTSVSDRTIGQRLALALFWGSITAAVLARFIARVIS